MTSAPDLRQRVPDRCAGDLHESAVGPVHLQDQEDRAGDGQRADEQRRNDGGVAARVEAEAGEQRTSQNTSTTRKGQDSAPPAYS